MGLLLLGLGCSVPEAEKFEKPFFDVKGFFKQEITKRDSLAQINPNKQATKKAMLNGNTEDKSLNHSDINWEDELASFVQLDINKPAWFDKYDAQVVDERKTYQRYIYTAKNEKLRVQKLVVETNDGEPLKVIAELKTNNPLYTSNQTLEYYTKWGYKINGNQKIRFLKASEYTVELKY